jgi:5-methylcytosine-specific restriction enzyme A
MGVPGTGDLDHLYDSARLHRVRKRQLQEHPLCKFCAERGIVTPATICDHVEPHRGDINKFWLGALQSLCLQCHLTAKRDVEERGYRRDIGFDGWPLDPRHPCLYVREQEESLKKLTRLYRSKRAFCRHSTFISDRQQSAILR